MRFAHACLAALSALALLSGCLESGPTADDLADADRTSVAVDEEAMAPAQADTRDFAWAASVAAGTGANVQLMATNGAHLDVDEGRSALLANVTWSCATPLCDMHVWLCSPEEIAATPFDPTDIVNPRQCAVHEVGPGPYAFEVTDPMPGEWVVTVMSDGPTVDVSGTIEFYAA
jgi:hypothetical protein